MSVKIEKLGNYLVATDVATGKVEVNKPVKYVWFEANANTEEVRLFDTQYNNQLGRNYPLSATYATGSVTLTGGASGQVTMITVNSVEIMSGAEVFDTDLATTAANVADNINAHTSSPNYTASAEGAVITITATVSGTGPNTFVVATTATTITKTDANMAGATTSIVDTSGVPYANFAAVLSFLRSNTGA